MNQRDIVSVNVRLKLVGIYCKTAFVRSFILCHQKDITVKQVNFQKKLMKGDENYLRKACDLIKVCHINTGVIVTISGEALCRTGAKEIISCRKF